jgi:hypothetical protein
MYVDIKPQIGSGSAAQSTAADRDKHGRGSDQVFIQVNVAVEITLRCITHGLTACWLAHPSPSDPHLCDVVAHVYLLQMQACVDG